VNPRFWISISYSESFQDIGLMISDCHCEQKIRVFPSWVSAFLHFGQQFPLRIILILGFYLLIDPTWGNPGQISTYLDWGIAFFSYTVLKGLIKLDCGDMHKRMGKVECFWVQELPEREEICLHFVGKWHWRAASIWGQ